MAPPSKKQPVRIDLSEPVQIALKNPHTGEVSSTEIIDHVMVRPAKGKDLRALNGIEGEIEQGFRMMERLTGLMGYQLDELDAEDIKKIGDVVAAFTEAGGPIGTTSSPK